MKEIKGYTTGVFDMFHIGHLNIIKKSKQNCDYLIVGITTDELCMKIKGKKPIVPFSERVEIVRALKYVDEVIAQDRVDEIGDYQKYEFDRIFKGSDWKNTEKWNTLEEYFLSVDVKVMFFEYTDTTTSTELRKKLLNIKN